MKCRVQQLTTNQAALPHNLTVFLSPGNNPSVPRGGQDGTRPRWHGKGESAGGVTKKMNVFTADRWVGNAPRLKTTPQRQQWVLIGHTMGWTWTPRLRASSFPPGLGFLSEVRRVTEFPKRPEGNLAGRRRAGPGLTPRPSQGTEHLG